MKTKRILRWGIVLFLLAALPGLTVALAQDEQPPAKQPLPPVTEPGESAALPPTSSEYEPNNTLGTANNLGFNTGAISGKIDYPGDVDYFTFSINNSVNALFDIDAVSMESWLDSVVCLLDASGTELACNDDADTLDSMVFSNIGYENSGWQDYYVRVTDYGNYHGGDNHFYELLGSNPLLVSATVNGTVAGVPFKSGDILAHSDLWYDVQKWVMFFDASDVGITKNLSNFDLDGSRNLLIGFAVNQPLPGLGTVTPWDIVRFTPTRYGPTTEGVFSWYEKGKDNGLTTTGEKIDAIIGDIGLHSYAWCYGHVISTTGTAKFGTQTYQDDDLLCGEGVGYGEFTNGAEVPGLAVEDVIAADYEDNGDDELVYLTILGTGRVSGYPVNQKDIFAITYLYPSIWQRLVWHGPDWGWNFNIDAFEYDPE